MILGEGLNYSYTSKIIGKEETENFVFFSGNIPEFCRKFRNFFFRNFSGKFRNFFFRNFVGISGIFFFGIFPENSEFFFSGILSEFPEFFFSEFFRNIPEFFFPELKIPEFFRNSGISGKFYQP